MEDQLKAVEWARKQKKKILEKNYKDNNPPGGLCGSPGFLLDNLNGEKSLARQLLHGILTVVLLKKYSFW